MKVSCTDANGNVCKKELPVFTNKMPKDLRILLLEKSLAMVERFEWFNAIEGNNNAKANLILQHFGRVLKGMPQTKLKINEKVS